ncbi:MAG: D-glycerate dehydrogenase [Planctomycetes bacterium]|nr:D-glycerate dehydrogenase [Planctomycetota bacterium]
MSHSVYVTSIIPEPGIQIVKDFCPDAEVYSEDQIHPRDLLLEKIKGRDGVLTLLTDAVDKEFMDTVGPQLKVISNYAVGYNNIDVEEATRRKIVVGNTPGVLTDATSDMAWALLFSTARRCAESDKFTRAGKFHGWRPTLFLGGDITGRTLGIIGAGRIGASMAMKSVGFRMKVLYFDLNENKEMEETLGAKKVDLDTLLKESDFVSVHTILDDTTRHLIGKRELGMMKKSAYIVNTSRGPVIDEAALVEALKNKTIAGAGLDVYEDEPELKPGLIECENAVLTPHIASATIWTRGRMAEMAANNLVAGLKGERPPNLVNPEALD